MVKPAIRVPTKSDLQAVHPLQLQAGTEFWRLFHSDSYSGDAEDFRHFGPVSRYDHHLPVMGKTSKSPDRSTLYMARDIGVAIAEVFGDKRVVRACPQWRVARLELRAALQTLDLTSTNVMHTGAFASIIGLGRKQSQRWARKVYELRPDIHGITYVGSHDYGDCHVLFDRANEMDPNGAVSVIEVSGAQEVYKLARLPALQRSEVQTALEKRRMKIVNVSKDDCEVCQDAARHP